MKRKIINIDEDKCNGCGLCVPNCAEGAIKIIDGKARLLGDLFCDGLGACLGHCPEEAITIEEREAEPYNERKVMEHIITQGPNVIRAHLLHMKEHNEIGYLNEALEFLKEKNIETDISTTDNQEKNMSFGGCPGARAMDFSEEKKESGGDESGRRQSHLNQWPVQLHLVSPTAPYFQGADLLLAADCVAFSLADFHRDYLKGKGLAIACPKLDEGQDVYIDKLSSMIDDAKINTLTVMTMQVPCCGGLLRIAKSAVEKSTRKVPVKSIVVGIRGEILNEEWV
ncbi:4Fe-4S ferredoxin [Chitinispirillum alkaliphilum]|nr:4Fe-4S ferredoxin [Chitinispirillum alkaliphilum]